MVEYATELQHLRSVSGFFEVDKNQEQDELILQECIEQYEEMKE
nr:MAG TPA: hypothetical protein [Caudoviricetes sp.]